METPPQTPPPASDRPPTDPQRIKAFATFFKNYMSVSALVTAALPIPITSFRLIPMYKSQAPLFSTYTSLFCFLLLGFIFYSRHSIARWMFPEYLPTKETRWERFRHWFSHWFIAVLPLGLVVLSLMFVFLYQMLLDSSIYEAVGFMVKNPRNEAESIALPAVAVLDHAPLALIPFRYYLMASYLGIFLFAESAFILMAIREYLQDLLKISDTELIFAQRGKAD
jgi:hypothetical protein